jgi:hypothetical protein
MAASDCDALALLVVRLESPTPPSGDLHWHPWKKSIGAETHGLPAEINLKSELESPFKRMPREDGWPYFNDHVERVLFPPGNEGRGRWLCCPDQTRLEFAMRDGGPVRIARIDLLERLASPLEIGCTFGLIHLSLLPSDDAGAPDTLNWARAISSLFRRPPFWSKLDLIREGRKTNLAVGRPVRALTESLFGDPDPNLERSLYTVVMAQSPQDCRGDAGLEREWRRALAKRLHEVKPSKEDDPEELNGERRQTYPIGPSTSLILGRHATLTLPTRINGKDARNLRSYWAESIIFGLLQQDGLEQFQNRLAAIEDPFDPEVQTLRHNWLKFRNVLWWSQLAANAEPPQELLKRLRNELGTERLFADLEGDLITYSEQQQANALANLQIYGAPFIVFGALITAVGLFDLTDRQFEISIAVAALIAIFASLFVRWKLTGRLLPQALVR